MTSDFHALHVSFPPWTQAQVARHGLRVVQHGLQARVTMLPQHMRFALHADATRADPVATRITELASDRPRRWQPAIDHPIVLSAQVRFDQAQPPLHLTETIFFWTGLTPPVWAIGVTRDHGQYAAIVAVNVDPTRRSGIFHRTPVPTALRADAWHTIDIVIAVNQATITVDDRSVLDIALPQPPPALAAELSVDNHNFPEGHLPIRIPDALTVRTLTITQAGAS